MPQNVRIDCVTKTPRFAPHDRIDSIGGANDDGTRWRLSLAAAIAGIERGAWRFYVTVNGQTVGVEIATSARGNKYLKTEKDGEQPNNLLSLPEC